MRRTLALALAISAIAAIPAGASSHDTRIDRHNEHVGMVVETAPTRWYIQNVDYRNVADVRREGSHEFRFTRNGRYLGRVHGATQDRWDVFIAGRSARIGYVTRRSRRTWRAYSADSGWAIGEATGTAPIQGAAAVLINWPLPRYGLG
jgi:hypothetical protein